MLDHDAIMAGLLVVAAASNSRRFKPPTAILFQERRTAKAAKTAAVDLCSRLKASLVL
jgi:hypothetical protein